jgi:hypothetical protein
MGYLKTAVTFLGASIVPTSFIYSRPRNAKELFNLRHAQLRNVVERIFGIVKRRWSIFTRAQEYPIETQARFVSAIGALHNFIRVHDATDDAQDLAADGPPSAAPLRHEDSVQDFVGDEPREISLEELGMDISAEEREWASARWDCIAEQMWKNYLACLAERGEKPQGGLSFNWKHTVLAQRTIKQF